MLKKPRLIPTNSGVYIFRKDKTPLYVGKAASLKKRVSSYFKRNAGWKIDQLRRESTKIEFIKTPSEIEALIKEAELIKKHVPKFNILMRDDKSFTYIGITRGEFPRFYLTHQLTRGQVTGGRWRGKRLNKSSSPIPYHLAPTFIGPFVESSTLKQTLYMLRGIFPYCTCKEPHYGKCVNAQIGRCPGYCCEKGRIATKEEIGQYQKNVRAVVSILSGKRHALLKGLKKEMRDTSRRQEFERAAKLRDQIYGLESLHEHRGIATHQRAEIPYHKIERVLQSLLKTRDPIRRVEGYDIANISGTDSTASMIVFYDGRPDKSQYRKFKIKTVAGPNDVASHREVLRRRLIHSEWEYPDLILIDGGKPQLNAVLPLLNAKAFRKIKMLALSKPPRRHFTRAPSGAGQNEDLLHFAGRAQPMPIKSLPPPVMYFLQRVRDESHRFVRHYHHLLRRKSTLNIKS
ncbi:MAG: GIY-YIG nuclease family protein [Candidatus Sungbacteria bacterium]|uniref:GIY-YIG nuclease family protein n=1 Tax=Candidatus Sungiibacteriota bacterium TaxID=2750080 RepID=A0A931WPA4_9BACT|nr:GIY-YIG nuclease family protein [Candidatus Sungbacteria bacterium]